jgi:protein-L-isoaspartate(D-aspartate) O-methyltransferase
MSDLQTAHDLMVDGQLRPNRVRDRRILDTMRRLDRTRFVPPAQAPLAYIDANVPVSPGRFLLKPLVIARLLQLAAPVAGETALIVGAGTGYGAAVLAACGVHVTALEDDHALAAMSREAVRDEAFPVSFVSGPLAEGWAERAPYDLVFIEGAVRAIPERIGRQVAASGRLVTVIAPEGAASYAVMAEPTVGGLAARPAFDAVAPLLPGLLPAPAFVF